SDNPVDRLSSAACFSLLQRSHTRACKHQQASQAAPLLQRDEDRLHRFRRKMPDRKRHASWQGCHCGCPGRHFKPRLARCIGATLLEPLDVDPLVRPSRLALLSRRGALRTRCSIIACSQWKKNRSATPNDIFDFPCTRSRKTMGISRTRSVPRARTIVSKTILKPLVCGASSRNRERPIAKKPHMESCRPVSG